MNSNTLNSLNLTTSTEISSQENTLPNQTNSSSPKGYIDGANGVEQVSVALSSQPSSPAPHNTPDLARFHLDPSEADTAWAPGGLLSGRITSNVHSTPLKASSEVSSGVHLANAENAPQFQEKITSEHHFSDQVRFERQLEMIAGRGLSVDDKIGGELRTRELDGVEMIAQLAEGKIEFPLQAPSLKNHSLRELRYAIAFALQENIKKLDERINFLKATEEKSTITQQNIEYLENYRESLDVGKKILSNLTEHVEEPGSREEDLVFETIEMLHKCFDMHKKSLKTLALGNIDQASYENVQALARIRVTEETMGPPVVRDHIIAGYHEVFALYDKALGAHREVADCLHRQANALFQVIEQKARRSPNKVLIDEYNRQVEYYATLAAHTAEYYGTRPNG